jgi:hypothetical protein
MIRQALRKRIKAARKRGSRVVALLDTVRSLLTAEGRARLWTKFRHGDEVHQTTPFTSPDRYPELFDAVARLVPDARHILSFGCSTGEELIALRRRFPGAQIVGAEINPRSRRLARKLTASDAAISVVAPSQVSGSYDAVFALAVFQREPHKMDELEIDDLSAFYPFERFDAGVTSLLERLRPEGILCVINNQYRVEDSSAAEQLAAVDESPIGNGPFFAPDGRRSEQLTGRTIFRKRAG